MERKVTEGQRKIIAGKQFNKCANSPGSKLDKLENYPCPLWQRSINSGCFDESGYEIDHIIEHSVSKDDSESNLQALCVTCHRVKTKRFNVNRTKKSHPIYGIKLYSYGKHNVYLGSSKKIYANTKIWSKNRPVDKSRFPEISLYIKKTENVDGIIYLANLDKEGLVCYDGNHRRSCLGLLKKDYKIIIDVVENPSYRYLCEKFRSLNKCIPMMELYEEPDRFTSEFKLIIYEVLDKLTKEWPQNVSTSPNPRKPNFNRDVFGNDLVKIILDNNIKKITTETLFNSLIKLNNYNKRNLSKFKLSTKIQEKCKKNNCYLFISNLDSLVHFF